MVEVCPLCNGDLIGCPNCGNPAPRRKLSFKRKALMRLSTLVMPAREWEVQGIDISKWNGVMDFNITKTKCQYVIMRLGYGDQWKDARADEYYRQLQAVDMPVAVYWYAKIGQNWRMHADSFAEQIALHPPQKGAVIDAEETSADQYESLQWLKNFDGRLRSLTGLIPAVYTSSGFWDAKIARSTYFSDRMNHVASWTTGPAPALPKDLPLWGDWQWSADGNRKAKEYGMIRDGDPDMDLDRSFYTVEQFNSVYGTHIKKLGDVPPMPLPEFFYPNGSPGYVNIRSQPNPFSDTYVIGRATNGKEWKPQAIVTGTDGKEWWQVNEHVYVAKWLTKW